MQSQATRIAGAAKYLPCPAVAPGRDSDAARIPSTFTLPEWADNDEARDVLGRIVADDLRDPEPFQNDQDRCQRRYYGGAHAKRLRTIFDAGFVALLTREDAAMKSRQPTAAISAEMSAYLLQERPGELIARLLKAVQ